MLNAFVTVPDWFAWDNQGGGIAAARLDAGRPPDLVVLMVDSPAGQNQALYRVGKALDGEGNVTAGWTPWTEIPDWFSHDNQGAAVALVDVDDDGRQELVVAMVDSPAGRNQGFLRLGRALDDTGNVTGGWTAWIAIPDWFSWENQGISIAVTPPDAAGKHDLIVFMIDDSAQENRGLYRIARDIDTDGNVAGWTPWVDVPDWFSWENQGCGVAVTDLDRDGGSDLVIFQVDNAPGQNQAFYRVGKDLSADGVKADQWGPWLGVPNWFSWENQAAAIAVTELGGHYRLLAFMVDNPPEQNAGLYEAVDLEADPTRHGEWQLLAFHSGVLAVHAAVLPNGKVLFFAGSGSSATRFDSPRFGEEGQGIFMSVVWDPPANRSRTHRLCGQRPTSPLTSSAAETHSLATAACYPREAQRTTTRSGAARTPPSLISRQSSGRSSTRWLMVVGIRP